MGGPVGPTFATHKPSPFFLLPSPASHISSSTPRPRPGPPARSEPPAPPPPPPRPHCPHCVLVSSCLLSTVIRSSSSNNVPQQRPSLPGRFSGLGPPKLNPQAFKPVYRPSMGNRNGSLMRGAAVCYRSPMHGRGHPGPPTTNTHPTPHLACRWHRAKPTLLQLPHSGASACLQLALKPARHGQDSVPTLPHRKKKRH